MTDSFIKPIDQLVSAVLGGERLEKQDKLRAFINDGGTVVDLVNKGQTGLVKEFGLHSQEAGALIELAHSLALHIAREFREQRSLMSAPVATVPRNGVRALVTGPTFVNMFKPDFSRNTPADSLEASNSPVAYLIELIVWALKHIEATGEEEDHGKRIKLFDRRRDLRTLLIDFDVVNRVLPATVIVNSVLENEIRSHLSDDDDNDPKDDARIDDLMREARYPNTLPFDRHWRAIDYVLGEKGLLLGDLVRGLDIRFPYFKARGGHAGLSDVALRQASGLGPVQQQLLLEKPYFIPTPEDLTEFYQLHFGTAFGGNMFQLTYFCERTQLTRAQFEDLISIDVFAPMRSPNAPGPSYIEPPEQENPDFTLTTPLTSAQFGSVFINNRREPPIDVEPNSVSWMYRIIADHDHMDRMNRMVRLCKWLKLSAGQTDQLVMAAIYAESRGNAKARRAAGPWLMSSNTMRALGLFQTLRARYDCSAEEFAALIDEFSVYGRGSEHSQFDRIFNAQSLFAEPLVVDDGAFSIVPRTPEDQLTADQICTALGINFETYRYLASVIAAVHHLEKELYRSVPILSSFYRVVRFARLLGITTIEVLALLETMDQDGDGWLAQFVGITHIATYETYTKTDVLSVMHALLSCIEWLRESELTVLWLVQHIAPVVVQGVASEAELRLFKQMRSQLEPALFTEASLFDAGVPRLGNLEEQGLWLAKLDVLVDPDGLVIGRSQEVEEDYQRIAVVEIEAAVALTPINEEDRPWVEAAILAVLLRARMAQRAVVQESLSTHLVLAPDLMLLVLAWADGSVYQILKETMQVSEQDGVGKAALALLVELTRRSSIVQKLALSSAMLTAFISDENWKWLGLNQMSELSLRTVYYLTIFSRAVKLARQPAEKLLDYLQLVNAQPDDLSEDGLRLVRDAAASMLANFFGWGIREVLECALHVNPTTPLIRSFAELDLLIRARELASRSGLDARALIVLGQLTPGDDPESYRAAAERALESLSESSIPASTQEFGEIGQSLTTRCIVDPVRLIANVPEEVATYTITFLDFFGEPLKQIRGTARTDLGVLLDTEFMTDHQGRATVRLQAGNRMGMAHVRLTVGLDVIVALDPLIIDCDETSIEFAAELKSPVPDRPLLAGKVGSWRLSVPLLDRYLNPAIDRMVKWETSLGVVLPDQTLTDQGGYSTITLLSADEGEAIVTAEYEGGKIEFDPIRFVDQARIDGELYVISQAVAGDDLRVCCDVVGLDGKPAAGEIVSWRSGDQQEQTTTSEEGVATFTVIEPETGLLTVSATLASGEKTLDIYVARAAKISGWSDSFKLPVAGAREPTMLWIEVRESPTEPKTEEKAIAHYPVWWSVSRGVQAALAPTDEICTPTSENGRSSFPFKVEQPGGYIVFARLGGGADQVHMFELEVIPAFAVERYADPLGRVSCQTNG